MKALLLLADAGQADNTGKLHALGVGWSVTGTPTPPMAMLIFIDVPWDQTNTKHKLEIQLLDADGQLVTGGVGPLGDPQPLFQVDAEFEAGRPPGIPPGTPIRQTLAIGLAPGMPLIPGEKYEFHMTIDGEHKDGWLSTFMVRPS